MLLVHKPFVVVGAADGAVRFYDYQFRTQVPRRRRERAGNGSAFCSCGPLESGLPCACRGKKEHYTRRSVTLIGMLQRVL